MRRLLFVALLTGMPLVVSADEDGASAAQSGMPGTDDARRERYRRRHDMLMERVMKKGQVVPVVPVVPPPPCGASMPPSPVVAVAPVPLYGNVVANPAFAEEPVSIKVLSLSYDEKEKRGVLTVAVDGGSFSGVNRYLRSNVGKLARSEAPGIAAPKIPPDARLMIESINIDEDDVCEVKFKAREK